jgi:hypothetical protein|tara:strand:- start:1344 stop:2759 length:1416 start_codon:yes stop_codon:yes gene_type:complete
VTYDQPKFLSLMLEEHGGGEKYYPCSVHRDPESSDYNKIVVFGNQTDRLRSLNLAWAQPNIRSRPETGFEQYFAQGTVGAYTGGNAVDAEFPEAIFPVAEISINNITITHHFENDGQLCELSLWPLPQSWPQLHRTFHWDGRVEGRANKRSEWRALPGALKLRLAAKRMIAARDREREEQFFVPVIHLKPKSGVVMSDSEFEEECERSWRYIKPAASLYFRTDLSLVAKQTSATFGLSTRAWPRTFAAQRRDDEFHHLVTQIAPAKFIQSAVKSLTIRQVKPQEFHAAVLRHIEGLNAPTLEASILAYFGSIEIALNAIETFLGLDRNLLAKEETTLLKKRLKGAVRASTGFWSGLETWQRQIMGHILQPPYVRLLDRIEKVFSSFDSRTPEHDKSIISLASEAVRYRNKITHGEIQYAYEEIVKNKIISRWMSEKMLYLMCEMNNITPEHSELDYAIGAFNGESIEFSQF